MKPLSRSLFVAGCAVAGSDAVAMPGPVWHGATHFGFDCRIEGESAADAKRFCDTLGTAGSQLLKLPFRSEVGVDGVTLELTMRGSGKQLTGTMVAKRPALRGETDEQSPVVPISIDTATPEPGFVRALTIVRNPQQQPVPRRHRSHL